MCADWHAAFGIHRATVSLLTSIATLGPLLIVVALWPLGAAVQNHAFALVIATETLLAHASSTHATGFVVGLTIDACLCVLPTRFLFEQFYNIKLEFV